MKATFYGFSGRVLTGVLQLVGSVFAILAPADKKSKQVAVVNFHTMDSSTIFYPKTTVSVRDQETALNEIFEQENKKFTIGLTVHGVSEILDYDLDDITSDTPAEDLELRVRNVEIENGIMTGEYLDSGYGLPSGCDEDGEPYYDEDGGEDYPAWDEFECPVKYVDYILVDEHTEDEEDEIEATEEYEVFEG